MKKSQDFLKKMNNPAIADYQSSWKSSPAPLLEGRKRQKMSKIGVILTIDISNDLCYY